MKKRYLREASGFRQDPTRRFWSEEELDQMIAKNGWDRFEDADQAWDAVMSKTRDYELAYAISDRFSNAEPRESVIRMRMGVLRKIIFEALNEAEADDANAGGPPYHELEDDSLDVKLDNYFVDSENGGQEDMGESWLREAEDDPPAPAGGGADGGEEAPAGPDIPEEEMKIDAAGFSREVAHLIENFTNLMDVKGVVLRRALNYVGKKYGKEQASTVKDVLETQFGVYSDEKEEPQAPGAANAGPALAG